MLIRRLLILAIGFLFSLSACTPVSPDFGESEPSPAVKNTLTPGKILSATPTRDSSTFTPTPRETIALTDEDLRGTVIHFWHAWTGNSVKLIEQLVDEFNLNNRWGIVVVPVEHSSFDELYGDLDIAYAQRNSPNLVTAFTPQALSWADAGRLVNLEPYLNDPIWGMSLDEQADFYPIFWQSEKFGDLILGVPAQRSGQLLYYNRSWAEELGFDSPPPNPQAFARQACAAAIAYRQDETPDNDGMGGWIISEGDRPDYSAILSWIYAFGGEVVSIDQVNQSSSTPVERANPYQFNTPQVKEAFTFLRRLYDNACARFAVVDHPEIEFANRRGLFSTGSVMNLPYQAEAFKSAANNDRWTVLPFPSPESQPAMTVYGPSFRILPSSPQEQLAAWVFTKWLLSPENQARLVRVTNAYPLRRSTLDYLVDFQQQNPQWTTAVNMLDSAIAEPSLRSWSTVRWALSDASTQLFRSYFTIDQVPNLVSLLQNTAAELHLGPDLEEVFATPLPEKSPTP